MKRKRKQVLTIVWGIVKLLLIWLAVLLLLLLFLLLMGDFSFATTFKLSLMFFPLMGLVFLFNLGTDSLEIVASVVKFFFKKIEEEVYSIDEVISGMPPARTYINSKDRVLVEEEDTELIPTITIRSPQEDNRRPTSF